MQQQVAATRGMIGMDGRQPACMQQQAADAACMRQRAAAVACMRQHAAVVACVRQRAGAAGSTIAMGDSDGSGQLAAQLQWAVVTAAQRTVGWRQDRDGQWRQQWSTVG